MANEPLKLKATNLGPVTVIDATLSKYAQNLIYARNGTGKSFLTRALRYLDLHAQGMDVANTAFDLVSEESSDGRGGFTLTRGGTSLGTLSLDCSRKDASANPHDRIFHVFSDDFVHSELRQQNFAPDGNIDNQIQLDQTNIDTKDVELRRDKANKQANIKRDELKDTLDAAKTDELVGKASVRRQLTEYAVLTIDQIMATTCQPELPDRSFKEIVSDLDSLKAIPAEPVYPNIVATMPLPTNRLNEIRSVIEKITSPSTVSTELKELLGAKPEFFETGLNLLKESDTENCPFCSQSVAHSPAKNRIELYLQYFADAEGKHKKELRSAWSDVKSMRSVAKDRIASIAAEVLNYEALRKLVPSQKNTILPDFSEVAAHLDSALGELLMAVETKGASPSSVITIPQDSIAPLIMQLNAYVEALNQKFNEIIRAVSQADKERKRLQRDACRTFKQEFVHSHWSDIDAINSYYRDVQLAQEELNILKSSQISASVKERVSQTFEILIASFFGKKYSFDRADFVLKRNDKKMARGVHRTLSDGEKTAIAFCYFIACSHKKVKSTSDYAKLFLVFDDPITSMSYDFVFAIAQTLKNMSISAVGEVSINPTDLNKSKRPDLLIFTHSSYFYNICVNNRVVKDGAAFFLHNAGQQHKLSRRDQFVAPFEQHLKEVVDVHNGQDPSHTTGNAVRCILEAIGRFCHPDKTSLTDFITYLAGDGGFAVKSVLINNLSHGTYYDEVPSPDELREACTETVQIVEKYAKGQLEVVRLLSTTPANK
ncbi:AAA family ATPase [Acetobacter sp.]|uniref:AAA family ATPase n=1 Tax=Acetobacter sp. TaxID=440 RepID=UPI0039E9E95E